MPNAKRKPPARKPKPRPKPSHADPARWLLTAFMDRYGAYAFGVIAFVVILYSGAFATDFALRAVNRQIGPVMRDWRDASAQQQQLAVTQEANHRAMETNLRLSQETLRMVDRTLGKLERIDEPQMHTVQPQ